MLTSSNVFCLTTYKIFENILPGTKIVRKLQQYFLDPEKIAILQKSFWKKFTYLAHEMPNSFLKSFTNFSISFRHNTKNTIHEFCHKCILASHNAFKTFDSKRTQLAKTSPDGPEPVCFWILDSPYLKVAIVHFVVLLVL